MKTITLTDDQVIKLAMYLQMTTNFREDELGACHSLAKELNENGSPTYPNMVSNANWWEDTKKALEQIHFILEKEAPSE